MPVQLKQLFGFCGSVEDVRFSGDPERFAIIEYGAPGVSSLASPSQPQQHSHWVQSMADVRLPQYQCVPAGCNTMSTLRAMSSASRAGVCPSTAHAAEGCRGLLLHSNSGVPAAWAVPRGPSALAVQPYLTSPIAPAVLRECRKADTPGV